MNLSTHKRLEVDVRVAQEIKNHQDVIYQLGQRIQSLEQGVIALSLQNEKLMNKGERDKVDLKIAFENFTDSVLFNHDKMNARLRELERSMVDLERKFSDLEERLEDEFATEYQFLEVTEDLENRIRSLQLKSDVRSDTYQASLEMMKNQLLHEISKVEEKLTPQAIEGDPVQDKITQSLIPFRVDFEGLKTEIAIIKKALAYDQKKFEYLTTRIERLKEGKA